jgi:outer membrane protein OmpA-like peptidoglycan-associated protein
MMASAQKDNPVCAAKAYYLFNSMEDFYLKECDTAEFKTLEFYIERGAKSIKKQGKYTKIHYEQIPTSTRTVVGQQIVTNHVNAVKKAKGEVVKASDDQAYHVTKDGKSLWIFLSVSPYAPARREYWIEIVEEQGMKQEIVANFDEALASDGKIALYGIYFDVGKAVVKAESEEAIKEIADYLTRNPKQSIFIVGHTDNTGDFTKNIKLSKDRALAIKNYLVAKYKIVVTRLIADGVGPLAPISTNATEDGKQKNRRVEIVLK